MTTEPILSSFPVKDEMMNVFHAFDQFFRTPINTQNNVSENSVAKQTVSTQHQPPDVLSIDAYLRTVLMTEPFPNRTSVVIKRYFFSNNTTGHVWGMLSGDEAWQKIAMMLKSYDPKQYEFWLLVNGGWKEFGAILPNKQRKSQTLLHKN